MMLNDNNVKILIIDDDEISRLMTQMILTKKCPYSVYTAHSGMKGIEIMHQMDINLVLLDVTMPIWDGFKTLEIMREEERLKAIPVILLTASADIETVIKANDYGAVNYIKKPFLPEELVDRVSKAILNEWQKPKENDKPKSNVETTDKNEKDDQPKIRFDDESFDDEYHSDFRHRFGDFF